MATKNERNKVLINEPAFADMLTVLSLYDCIGVSSFVEIIGVCRGEEIDPFEVATKTAACLKLAEIGRRKVFYTVMYGDRCGDDVTFHVFTVARDRRQAKSIFKMLDESGEE